MVKCPRCGSTAQVRLDSVDYDDGYIIVICNCGCGCRFRLSGKAEIEIE